MGKEFSSCMIKEIGKLLKQLGFSLNIWQSELVILLIFLIRKTIIIGGGITDRGNEFLKEVKEEVSKYLNQEIYNNCEIELAQNGNCAGMIGAIYHFLHHHK